MPKDSLESQFPNLGNSHHQITSPKTEEYNCIAWAAGDSDSWWWPDPLETEYWPEGVERMETLEAFIKAFETLNYSECDCYDYESGTPTHASRQLKSGYWTSKLGEHFDIEHEREGLSNSIVYGNISVVMKRSC